MFADRKNASSPGLRVLLGRLVHGLFPHRFLQLLGAAWSYLMGPWDASSFLPSGWLFHRSVQSGELPEVLEVLGLRPGSWEELGECLDDLGPWKELPSEVDLLKSWKGACGKDDESAAFDDLAAWQKAMVHRNMQVFWEPALTSWNVLTNPQEEDDQCYKQVFSPPEQMLDIEANKVSHEKQPPSVGLISCILNIGAAGALARVERKDEQIRDAAVDGPYQGEFEIQQIRNKRLRFLERKEAQEDCDVKVEGKEKKQGMVPDPPEHFPSPSQLVSNEDLDVSQCNNIICDQCELSSHVGMIQGDFMVFPETNEICSSCDKLPVGVQEGDKSDNLHHLCPDKDQGYHSLEYWQCSPLLQNTSTSDSVSSVLPTETPSCPSFVEDENNEDFNCDLKDERPFSPVTSCTNKHIGYILGTVVSDDDDDDKDLNSSSGDEWDKEEKEEEEEKGEEGDDGFDSEGSISSTDSETNVSKDMLWNSFSSADPYNPQNFTASIHTGAVTGENVLSLDILDHQSDEESWCDSDADSDSDSDCSADEEENLKLWNAFLKSDDPYNPLQFKAPVQTSDKRQCSDTTCLEMTCRNLPNHKVSLVSCQAYDLHQLQCTEPHNVPLEDSANRGQKKVTFQEEVTIYYVCNEEQRKGHWEELARDRCRFQRRIKETELVIRHCLSPHHRQRAWERMQGHWGS